MEQSLLSNEQHIAETVITGMSRVREAAVLDTPQVHVTTATRRTDFRGHYSSS